MPPSLTIDAGTIADYAALARFHYRAGRPATFAAIYTIRHTPPRCTRLPRQVAAVAVLSWPVLSLHARERILGLEGLPAPEKHRFVNAHIRTISRVIVHPAFRSLGLAVRLVDHILHNCPTRCVEALALMGHLHPFFAAAGMRAFAPDNPDQPVYYLFDRAIAPPRSPLRRCVASSLGRFPSPTPAPYTSPPCRGLSPRGTSLRPSSACR